MSATYSAFAEPAIIVGQDCAKRMPFSMHPACMATTPNPLMIGTGVLASVSLFVSVLIVTIRLLVSLVVLLSLTLIGLTGLRGLVGLTVRLNPGAT